MAITVTEVRRAIFDSGMSDTEFEDDFKSYCEHVIERGTQDLYEPAADRGAPREATTAAAAETEPV